MNLVYWRITGDASKDHREKIDEALADSAAAWSSYENPAGTEDRPQGAPSWWAGDEEAAQVTRAGVATLQGRRGVAG